MAKPSSSVLEEILLLQASTRSDEFQWRGSEEEAKDWQERLEKWQQDGGGEASLSQDDSWPSSIAIALCLHPDQVWLHVDWSEGNQHTPQLTLHAPHLDRAVWQEVDKVLQQLQQSALQDHVEHVVFDVFTGLQAQLADGTISLPSTDQDGADETTTSKEQASLTQCAMSRVIFWTHHLKAPSKKRDMNKWCAELQVWGLVRSGYPGFLCFEGVREDVEVIVRRIKALQWAAITVKTDVPYTFTLHKADTPDDLRKAALRACALAHGHSSWREQDEGKVRTSMDEVQDSKQLVQRLRSARIPEEEILFALNLRS